MHYLLFYDYVPDYLIRRQPLRAAHFEYARPFIERGELVLGGALADPVDGAVLLFRGETPDVARTFAAADPFFKRYPLRFESVLDPPLLGHEVAADHPWTRCLYGAAQGLLGTKAHLSASQWPCDAFLVQGFSIPTLLFGPRGGGSHNPNEYVELPSVLRTAEVYLAAALDWCGSTAFKAPGRVR